MVHFVYFTTIKLEAKGVRSATYSISVEPILLFKLEFRFKKDLLCTRWVPDPSQALSKHDQESGGWLSALGLISSWGWGIMLIFYNILCFFLLWGRKKKSIKNSSNFNFSLISVAVQQLSAFLGFWHAFSVHVLLPLFLSPNTVHCDLLSPPAPANPSQHSQLFSIFPGHIQQAGYSAPYL